MVRSAQGALSGRTTDAVRKGPPRWKQNGGQPVFGVPVQTGQSGIEVVRDPGERAYDEAVRTLPGGSIYQAYSWGEIRRAEGLRPCRLLVVDGEGRAQAAVTWLVRPLPLGRSLVMATRGPIWQPHNPAALVRIVAEGRRLAASCGALACRLSPPVAARPEDIRALADLGLRPVHRARLPLGGTLPIREWHVPLDGSLDSVWRGLSSDHRRLIRRAERCRIVIEEGTVGDLPALWRHVRDSARLRGLPLRSERVLSAMARVWIERGEGVLFLARRDGGLVGSSLSTHFGSEALGHFVGDDGQSRHDGLVQALYWRFLSWAHARGARIANLGGVAAHPGRPGNAYGLELFKRHFGGQAVTYVGEWDNVTDPAAYAVLRAVESLFLEHGLLPRFALPALEIRGRIG